MAANVYEVARKRATQESNAGLQSQQDAIKRRFASMGGAAQGSQIKQERIAGEQAQQNLGSRIEAIDAAAAAEDERKAEIESSRKFATSERLGSQEFAAGERKQGQQFASSERASGQEFAAGEANKGRLFSAGENLANRLFSAAENELGRKFTTSEREAMQKYGISEREASQMFASGEAKKGREFTTSERVAGQEFAGGESEAARVFAEEQRQASEKFAAKESQLGRSFTKNENVLNRDLQKKIQAFNESQAGKELDLAMKNLALETAAQDFNIRLAKAMAIEDGVSKTAFYTPAEIAAYNAEEAARAKAGKAKTPSPQFGTSSNAPKFGA